MRCATCQTTRHFPRLGLCPAYDAEVLALAEQSDAERELLTDCFQCGAQLIRWANSPTKYEMDRRTIHLCDVHQQEPMATAAAVVGQRPIPRTTVGLAPVGAPSRRLSLRTID